MLPEIKTPRLNTEATIEQIRNIRTGENLSAKEKNAKTRVPKIKPS